MINYNSGKQTTQYSSDSTTGFGGSLQRGKPSSGASELTIYKKDSSTIWVLVKQETKRNETKRRNETKQEATP